MTAYIAQEYLSRTSPEALVWANNLLLPYTAMCGEDLYPFVEAATWSDKIKDQGWHLLDNHHFVSNWWYDEGAKPDKELPLDPTANIVFAIGDCIKTLTTVKEDPYGSSKSLMAKSIALRMLIHYLGDIHQPLHASERVLPGLPDGDIGGNLFRIKRYDNKYMDNLHFVWDQMFEKAEESIRSNLPYDKYQFIKRQADGIMAEYPFEQLLDKMTTNFNAKSWGLESFEIAKSFVYRGLRQDETIPADYEKEAWRICRERVALGGYRLGTILEKAFKFVNRPSVLTSTFINQVTEAQKEASMQLTPESKQAYLSNKKVQEEAMINSLAVSPTSSDEVRASSESSPSNN